jgi:hypothetical protein
MPKRGAADRFVTGSHCGMRWRISNSSRSTLRWTWPGGSGRTMDNSFVAISLPSRRTRRCTSRSSPAPAGHGISRYGDLPVHDGLWGGQATARRGRAAGGGADGAGSARARRDAATLERVRAQGRSAWRAHPERILDDEIRHVLAGSSHFAQICHRRGESVDECWIRLVKRHFPGAVKPPFNDSARLAGGLSRDAYTALA